MRVLVGCEESQAVTIELRKLGIEAYSCDIQECSGGHPEWHYQEDIFKVIEREHWDMLIAFPPCTHLAVSGARHFEQKKKDGRQQERIDFFMAIANANIKHIAVENPVGIMSNIYKKPSQIIQPYFFGDEAQKTTCLWLKNLPPLEHSNSINLFNKEITHCNKGEMVSTSTGKTFSKWYWDTSGKKGLERAKARSKTFPGIAKAMAEQWGNYVKETLTP